MKELLYLTFLPGVLAHGSHSHGSHSHGGSNSPIVSILQDHVFVFQPRFNALLATLIIQLIPIVVIYLLPGLKKQNGSGTFLKLLVSFALGTLLGDVFLHLMPEAFKNVHDEQLTMKSATAILLGFVGFMSLDKLLRVATMDANGESSHGHSHSHSHSHVPSVIEPTAKSESFNVETEKSSLKQRKKSKKNKSNIKIVNTPVDNTSVSNQDFNISAYLNVISSFAHNITDGFALASSFYTSCNVGVTTTIAVIFHEVPHEIGDFAILLSSGFTFLQAIKSQAVTSLGALFGTFIGCVINEMFTDSSNSKKVNLESIPGVDFGELMLSITAGGFIYIAATGTTPELLKNSSSNKIKEIGNFILQLVSIAVGFFLMSVLAD